MLWAGHVRHQAGGGDADWDIPLSDYVLLECTRALSSFKLSRFLVPVSLIAKCSFAVMPS